MGASAGGLHALSEILSGLNQDFSVPIVIVQHLSPDSKNLSIGQLGAKSRLYVKEADDKEILIPGFIYIAPPNYHLLIEKNGTFGLSVDAKVNFSRPSIDVLFETAAEAYLDNTVAVVLTGANGDGTAGCRKIRDFGGLIIVQDPETAEAKTMPASVIRHVGADYVLSLNEIIQLLSKISGENQNG